MPARNLIDRDELRRHLARTPGITTATLATIFRCHPASVRDALKSIKAVRVDWRAKLSNCRWGWKLP